MRAPEHSHHGDLDPVPERVISRDGISVRADLRRYLASLFPAWHRDAACAGQPLELFFPAKGGKGTEARAICATCPVITACLTEALEDESLDHGIRAGLSVPERRRLRAERGRGVT